MKFEFDNFVVYTETKVIQMRETIIVATGINGSKPSGYVEKQKTKEIIIFKQLNFMDSTENKYYRVLDDIFNFIDFIEIIKSFIGNKLEALELYKFEKFEVNVANKNKKVYLKIHFKNYAESLFLEKYQASTLAAKFSKILQRCEPWQEPVA